ncbi:MAG: AbrB/MazE/SpoVT family DNA-binding domain-containing protein [Ferrimicrobium sp.]
MKLAVALTTFQGWAIRFAWLDSGIYNWQIMRHYCYAVNVAKEKTFIVVQSRGVIAIPPAIRRRLGLDQAGAQVEVIERDGEIVLRPHLAVPMDQAWFWSERWQQLEREADEAIASGHVTDADGIDELLGELDS